MIIETEVKLTLDKNNISKLLQNSVIKEYAEKEVIKHHFYGVYFDNDDFWLLKNGFVLRVVQCDQEFTQTMKSANQSVNGLHQRKEWHSKVSDLTPDYRNVPDDKIKYLLLNREVELQALFVTDFERTAWHLVVDETEIELALDIGKVIVGDKSEDICEIELELISGHEKILLEVAKKLSEDVSAKFEDVNKAERGYKLYQSIL